MITEAEMLALTSELARVKSRQNIAAALAIYHPDIELVSPSFESISRGAAEAEKNLHVFFALFPDYRVTLADYACKGPMMLATGEVSVTPRIPGHPCPRVTVPVFLELRFEDERIIKETFFLDAGLICKRAGITPEQLRAAATNASQSTPRQELQAC